MRPIVAWEDEITADFWDLCWFRDKLYIATLSAHACTSVIAPAR